MIGRFPKQGGKKLDFSESQECKPFLLGLSLAGNLVKPLLNLYGTEWRGRGYELYFLQLTVGTPIAACHLVFHDCRSCCCGPSSPVQSPNLKLLRSLRTDSKEPVPAGCVA
jgi:hypothetical protein